MIYALEVPPVGGSLDTLFANMSLAYETLSWTDSPGVSPQRRRSLFVDLQTPVRP